MAKPAVSSRFALVLAAAAVVVGAAATVAVPVAARLASPPNPPIIATVDLDRVVALLTEKTDAEASMRAYIQSLQAELDTLAKDLKDNENKLQYLQGNEKKEAAAQLIEKRANAEVKKKVSEAKIDQRRGEVFRGLYTKITSAATRLAQQNKYTMVLVSDDKVGVPEGPSSDIERAIALKRFLFVDAAHDITSDLVTLMNNEYAANVAPAAIAPGAPAPAAAPK